MISGNVLFRSLTKKVNNSRDLLPKMLNSNPRIIKHPCFRAKTIRPSWPRGTITGLLKKTKIQQVHIHYCGIGGSGGLRDLGQSINYRVLTHQWPRPCDPSAHDQTCAVFYTPSHYILRNILFLKFLFIFTLLPKYTMQRATIL